AGHEITGVAAALGKVARVDTENLSCPQLVVGTRLLLHSLNLCQNVGGVRLQVLQACLLQHGEIGPARHRLEECVLDVRGRPFAACDKGDAESTLRLVGDAAETFDKRVNVFDFAPIFSATGFRNALTEVRDAEFCCEGLRRRSRVESRSCEKTTGKEFGCNPLLRLTLLLRQMPIEL